jgi:diguanylate cyclase (GGDEF)-like protein
MVPPTTFDPLMSLQTLNYTARLLVAELDASRLVARTLDAVVDFGRARRVALLKLDHESHTLALAGVLAPDSFVDPELTIALEDGPLQEVVASRKAATFAAALDAPAPLPARPGESADPDYECLVMPLVDSRAAVSGLLTLERPLNDPLSPEDSQALTVVVTLASVAMENANLFTLATTDGLTGLYVRRFFEIRLREELSRARRHGGGVGLIITDIDHFKKFNDTYGHQQGDSVLRELAALYRLGVRQDIDVPCRYGGEEFCAILPATDLDGTFRVAERLRIASAEHQYPSAKGPLKVTISAGVAVTQSPDVLTFEEIVSRADQALYRAKETGRNRVEMWSD